MPTPASSPIDLSLLDPYEAQAIRDRDRAQVNRRWWLVLAAAGTGLATYAYLLLSAARTVRLPSRALVNELTLGLALATAVSAIAILRTVRARWPAAVSLAGALLA